MLLIEYALYILRAVCFMQKDISDVAKELSEEDSEESSDNLSDCQSTENNSGAITPEDRRGRWMRRGMERHVKSLKKSEIRS